MKVPDTQHTVYQVQFVRSCLWIHMDDGSKQTGHCEAKWKEEVSLLLIIAFDRSSYTSWVMARLPPTLRDERCLSAPLIAKRAKQAGANAGSKQFEVQSEILVSVMNFFFRVYNIKEKTKHAWLPLSCFCHLEDSHHPWHLSYTFLCVRTLLLSLLFYSRSGTDALMLLGSFGSSVCMF